MIAPELTWADEVGQPSMCPFLQHLFGSRPGQLTWWSAISALLNWQSMQFVHEALLAA